MIIDTENLSTLSLPEVAVLLLLYNSKVDKSRTLSEVREEDLKNLLESLQLKGFVTSMVYETDFNHKPPYRKIAWSLLEKGKQALAENCQNMPKKAKTAMNKAKIIERCRILEPKLSELFPIGTKPGTSHKWRGSTSIVVKKLAKLIEEGNEFTDEEAVEATKEYIASFNGMYTTMRILPFFLGKREIVGGEVKETCDFMSYVEDLRNNNKGSVPNKDWDVKLC